MTHRLDHAAPTEQALHTATLAEAKRLLVSGRLAEAEATLVAIDAALEHAEGEPELSDFPRGLVGYIPTGDRGHPTTDEEEPMANRIRLVARLIEVRRSEGRDVEAWIAALRAAQSAYLDGDRARARRLCDAVLSQVEHERSGARATGA
ncbi:MAG: hypothetical protein L3J91_01980 [Thermoplasmata archaeon]|nr:hypothetical protein [Thermoplasmata archaeon]